MEYPRRALDEIHRILDASGIAIISSVFEFPIHNYPNDYWRFTPEGFRSLLKAFGHTEIFSFGASEVTPQCVVGVGFKSDPPDLGAFRKDCGNWQQWHSAIILEMRKTRQQDQPATESSPGNGGR